MLLKQFVVEVFSNLFVRDVDLLAQRSNPLPGGPGELISGSTFPRPAAFSTGDEPSVPITKKENGNQKDIPPSLEYSNRVGIETQETVKRDQTGNIKERDLTQDELKQSENPQDVDP